MSGSRRISLRCVTQPTSPQSCLSALNEHLVFTGNEMHSCSIQVVKFKSPVARAIFNSVFTKRHINTSEFFAPGRTAFVYELDSAFAPDVPTTLRRSKADCPPVSLSPFHCITAKACQSHAIWTMCLLDRMWPRDKLRNT